MAILIAHRGESFDAPENTLAAFDLAWQLGAAAIELDVHLSKDGHVVVCHDEDLLRTGGRKAVIAESTLAELQAVDVGAWKGSAWGDQRVPTLAEVMSNLPAGRKVFIEIKVGNIAASGVGVVERVLSAVPSSAVVCVISFDHELVRRVKTLSPACETAALFEVKFDQANSRWSPTPAEIAQAALAAGADGVDVEDGVWLDRAAAELLQSAGLQVYVWTVDDPARCQVLIELGVTGITTNRAAWIRRKIR